MRRTTLIATLFTMLCALPLAAWEVPGANEGAANQPAGEHAAPDHVPTEAVAVLSPTKGNDVRGLVLMKQMGDSLKIVGKVTGLTPGKHGFHIHEFGDLRDPEGKSAGDHYNPDGAKHGAPHDEERHAGDLGNITANEDGVATIELDVKGLKLHFIVGRSLVVHGEEDDLQSQPSGDSGPRVALGVIGFAQVKPPAK